jgi:hypothetical protein
MQGDPELAVAQAEVTLQMRNVRSPGGEQEAVRKEHSDDSKARPPVR